jgi:7-cyano-7-deazaguanine synthase
MIEPRAVVLVSGGMDSGTLLYFLARQGISCYPLAVNYGQRHAAELQYAAALVSRAQGWFSEQDVKLGNLRTLDVPDFADVADSSSQTSRKIPVPEGHYADATMRATVVPNRNMVLLSLAVAYAIAKKCQQVAYAAHAGDHAIYPDCRPAFVHALEGATMLCDYEPVYIRAPFLGMTKAAIARLGVDLHVPYGLTYSCYKGGVKHCGKCGTCVERREAFVVAGFADPTEYEEDAA